MAKVAFTLALNRFINLSFCHKFGRFRTFIGQNIDPKYWNPKTQRARADSGYPEHLQLNHLLDTYQTRILDYYRQCLIKSVIPTKQDFLKAMDGNLKDLDKDPRGTVFIESLIAERKGKPGFAPNTIKNYNSTLNLLNQYCFVKKTRPRLSEFNHELLSNFKDFALLSRKLSINSAAKHIRNLKAFLSEALKRDLEVTNKYKLFSLREQPVLKSYLTMGELHTLRDFDFEPRLRKAVDIFLIGAFTGLRFSDFSQLRIENIEIMAGHEIIKVRQAKTGGMVWIPLHPIVKRILVNYQGIPKAISQQKLNDYIKEACEACGITQKSIHYSNKAGVNKSSVVSKHELISTHTARRSFATNAYKSGIPSLEIMRITGHRTETAFKRYICIDSEEAVVSMAENKFFK